MFEASSLTNGALTIAEGAFCQYVFDNADFNSSTIDGLNTIHIMGGIQCITPGSAVAPLQQIRKLASQPTASEIANIPQTPMQTFDKDDGCGLKQVKVHDLSKCITLKAETQLPYRNNTATPNCTGEMNDRGLVATVWREQW
jgi:hypothetical protein